MKFSPNNSCVSIPGHTPSGAHEIIPFCTFRFKISSPGWAAASTANDSCTRTQGMWKTDALRRWSLDGRWHLQPPGEGAFDASQAQG